MGGRFVRTERREACHMSLEVFVLNATVNARSDGIVRLFTNFIKP